MDDEGAHVPGIDAARYDPNTYMYREGQNKYI